MATTETQTLASQIFAHLDSKSLPPTQEWLANFLSTTKQTVPIAALKQTALFRFLASDIRGNLQKTAISVLPSDVLDARIQERTISGPIAVQVLNVEDISSSRWSQVEAIEAAERGETTKGREIIRVVPGEEGLSDPNIAAAVSTSGGGPHKLLVQDANGVKIFALDLGGIEGVNMNMSIGSKIVLKNVTIARAVILLESRSATFMGGKIDALDKAWKQGRKTQLKATIEMSNGT